MNLLILGAIIGGGSSRRFGRDKATELVNGRALIEFALTALSKQVDEVVVCGRNWSSVKSLDDRPVPDLGPLGGVNAALHHASVAGFEGVLCMPVDVHPAPVNVVELLVGERLAVLNEQHLIGYWPTDLADSLEAYLVNGNRSVHGFLDEADAHRVPDPPGLTNVNWPHDLKKLNLTKRWRV